MERALFSVPMPLIAVRGAFATVGMETLHIPRPGTETGIWKLLMCLERPRTVSCRVPVLTSPAVREHTTCFLKGSLPFPVLQSWPRPPGVAAMNLKDLKRLRLLLDFISRGPDASGPHLEPQRLCGLLRPLSCSIYVFNLCVLCS